MEVMQKQRKIGPGIYLVIDPSMDKEVLYSKLDAVLKEKIAALQIWDNFGEEEDIPALIGELCRRCHARDVPVLINNRWQYLTNTPLDGVHFDAIPERYESIRAEVNRPFISGITCTNDMQPVVWAKGHGVDYISFCSMFPSATAGDCELVDHDSVRRATAIYDGLVFLAGGIKPSNISELSNLRYAGVAVISGIMNSDAPDHSIREYIKKS